MSAEDIMKMIEQFETIFDTFQQQLQDNLKHFIENLSNVWKNIKIVKEENENLESTIKEQDSELMALKTEAEGVGKNLNDLKSKKDTLTSKCTELTTELEKLNNNLKKPEFELETVISKIKNINEKITTKESEKIKLDQKKVDNEHREEEMKKNYADKMTELEKYIMQLKQQNFFTSFLIENSNEEIHEVDIIATIMEKGKCNLDEIKKQLNVPPIMAVRTIKQLAVKEIIKLNEDTNEVSLS